jgi:hypothetical protein
LELGEIEFALFGEIQSNHETISFAEWRSEWPESASAASWSYSALHFYRILKPLTDEALAQIPVDTLDLS